MFETVRSKIAARARRFARRQDGAVAVEFAFVAIPFLGLLFAILETALVFFAGQSLEASTAESARLILTGQAQTDISPTTGKVGYSQQDFKNVACANLSSLFDCAKLFVSVNTYASFASVNTSTPVAGGKLTIDTDNLPYNAGNPGDIVVVQLYYQWPIVVSLLDGGLSNLDGQKHLLMATSVFRNEPYQ